MSIVRLILLFLSAITSSSSLASLGVDDMQHADHAASSSSAFVEAVRQATQQFLDVDWNPRVSCEGR